MEHVISVQTIHDVVKYDIEDLHVRGVKMGRSLKVHLSDGKIVQVALFYSRPKPEEKVA